MIVKESGLLERKGRHMEIELDELRDKDRGGISKKEQNVCRDLSNLVL